MPPVGNALNAERQWRRRRCARDPARDGAVGNALNAERQWRHRTSSIGLSARTSSRERTKRRKAMETPPLPVGALVGDRVGNALNAERQWRQASVSADRKRAAPCRERTKRRKAMETRAHDARCLDCWHGRERTKRRKAMETRGGCTAPPLTATRRERTKRRKAMETDVHSRARRMRVHPVGNALNAERQWRLVAPFVGEGAQHLRRERTKRRKAMETTTGCQSVCFLWPRRERTKRRKAMETHSHSLTNPGLL